MKTEGRRLCCPRCAAQAPPSARFCSRCHFRLDAALLRLRVGDVELRGGWETIYLSQGTSEIVIPALGLRRVLAAAARLAAVLLRRPKPAREDRVLQFPRPDSGVGVAFTVGRAPDLVGRLEAASRAAIADFDEDPIEPGGSG